MNYKEKSKNRLINLMNCSTSITSSPDKYRFSPFIQTIDKSNIKKIGLNWIDRQYTNDIYMNLNIYYIEGKTVRYSFKVEADDVLDTIGVFESNYKYLLEILVAFSEDTLTKDKFPQRVKRNKDSVINILNKCRDKELKSSIEVTKLKLMLL